MFKKILFSLIYVLTFITVVKAQCPDPNPFKIEHFGTAGVGLTPAILNETVRAYGVTSTGYVVLHVEQDRKYRVSLLNSEALLIDAFGHPSQGFPPGFLSPNFTFGRPQVDFDPIITLYDNTGSTASFMLSGNVLAYNEDASATEILPELEYVAPYTGIIYIAVDLQPGTTAYNPGSGPPNVMIASALSDCSSITNDSTVVSVTRIPNNSLSIETAEEKLARTVWVYPNPSKSGKFSIGNYGNTLQSIDIVDINGRSVYKTNLNGSIEANELNVALEAGIYFLQIKSDKASVTKKLVVN